MIGNYLTDKIRVTTVTVDEWNRSTETTTDYDAKVEPSNLTIADSNGVDRKVSLSIILPYSASVPDGAKIKVLELNGQTITENSYMVISVEKLGGFETSHLEVMVGQ